MPKLKRVLQQVVKRGLFRYLRILFNCRMYSFFVKKKLPEICFTKPIHMQIEISKICNLKCRMCEYGFQNRNRRYMRLEEFRTILSRVPLLYSLDLTGIGEPFCNPDFMKIVSFAINKGIKVGFATNGILLTEGYMDELVAMGVENISFSVDASSKPTYEQIRVGSDFDKLKENISLLSRKVSKSKTKKPNLSLNYTIMRENVSEVVSFPQLARNVGVDTIFYRDLITFNSGNYSKEDGLESFSKEFRNRLKEQVLYKAKSIGVNVNFCESLFTIDQKRNKLCYRPWMSCYVDVSGNLYPCCHFTQKNIDIAPLSFGNIITHRLEEIWNILKYHDLRKELVRPGHIPVFCRGCVCLTKCDLSLKKWAQ